VPTPDDDERFAAASHYLYAGGLATFAAAAFGGGHPLTRAFAREHDKAAERYDLANPVSALKREEQLRAENARLREELEELRRKASDG